MKHLLRSTFVGKPGEDKDLLLRNYQALVDSGLGFEVIEDEVLWRFIQDFVQAHQHIPDFTSIRSHYEYVQENEVVDRLSHLVQLPLKVRGDFLTSLENHSTERKTRQVVELLKEASRIVQTGIIIDDGKTKKSLRGPQDAVRFILDQGHDIVAPTTGTRLSGDVTTDGDSFMREYERVESDPLAGIGQFTGIAQIDSSIRGAKRGELWTHAAFTGGLKCVTGDTRIFDLNSGKLRTVQNIYESGDAPLVHALDEKSWSMIQAQASPVVQNGVRPILQITSETGREIRVSGNHPFMTPMGWVDAENLCKGDWVAVPGEMSNNNVDSPFSDQEVAAIGYLLGDGHIKNDISFTNGNPAIIEDFVRCLESMGYRESNAKTKAKFLSYRYMDDRPESRMLRVSRSTGNSSSHPWISPLRKRLEDLGLWGCTSGNKHIPYEMWRMTDNQVWIFLSALWATDGSIKVDTTGKGRKPKPVMSYTTKSKQLAWDIQALLQRVGVCSTVSLVRVIYLGERRIYWSVGVTTNEGKRRFLSLVKVAGKEEAVEESLASVPTKNTDWVPPSLLDKVSDSVRALTRKGGWHYAKWAKRKGKIQRDTLVRLAKVFGEPDLLHKAVGNIHWERVRESVSDGTEMTYDLSVPGPANFVANGFITHNSTLAINWLYNQAVFYRHSSILFSCEMPYIQDRRIFYAIHSAHEKFADVRKSLGLGPCLDYSRIRDGNLDRYEDAVLDRMSDDEKAKLLMDSSGHHCINPARPEKRFLKEYVVPDFNDPRNEYGNIYVEGLDPDKMDFTVADLRSRAEILYSKDPDIAMVAIDHAGLMAPRKWVASTTERLNEVLRDLKKLAMNFNRGMGIAVVALFQISREGFKSAEKNGGLYNLTHLSYANECLVAGTLVPTDKGVIPIEDVRPGDQVWSRSGWKHVQENFCNGSRPIWSIETDRGATIETTGNHLIRVIEGEQFIWKTAQELRTGDWLLGTSGTYPWPKVSPILPPLKIRKWEKPCGEQGIPIVVPTYLTLALAYLLGAWDGDGKIHSQGVAYTGNILEIEVREGIRSRFKETFGHPIELIQSPSRPGSFDLTKWSQPLKQWVEDVAGLRGKEVPKVILGAPKELVLAYLRGLFDTDGWINIQNIIGIKMKSRFYLSQVQILLSLLGYDTDLRQTDTTLKVTGKTYEGWTLRLRGWDSKVRFAEEIGFTDPSRQKRLALCLVNPPKRKKHDQNYPFVNLFAKLVKDQLPYHLTREAGLRRSLFNKVKESKIRGVIPRDTLQYAVEFMQDKEIKDPRIGILQTVLSDLHIVQVRAVNQTDANKEVFDIEINGDHEYQTGPILSHNSERSSDIVTATWVDKDLKERCLVRVQCLKARDDAEFKPFFASVLWPCRLVRTCHDVSAEDARKAGEELDVNDLLDDD